jgi:hypothetical protein
MQKELDDEDPKELTWEAAAATETTYANRYLPRKMDHQELGYVERHLGNGSPCCYALGFTGLIIILSWSGRDPLKAGMGDVYIQWAKHGYSGVR